MRYSREQLHVLVDMLPLSTVDSAYKVVLEILTEGIEDPKKVEAMEKLQQRILMKS